MLIALTVVFMTGALILSCLSARRFSFRYGLIGALFALAAFVTALFLNIAWEWMLLGAIALFAVPLLWGRVSG